MKSKKLRKKKVSGGRRKKASKMKRGRRRFPLDAFPSVPADRPDLGESAFPKGESYRIPE